MVRKIAEAISHNKFKKRDHEREERRKEGRTRIERLEYEIDEDQSLSKFILRNAHAANQR